MIVYSRMAVSDLKDEEGGKVTFWYWLLPVVPSFIIGFILVIVNVNQGRFWSDALWIPFVFLVVGGLVSVIVYLTLNVVKKKVDELGYWKRAECNEFIKAEFLQRYLKEIELFTEVKDSHAVVGFYGGGKPREKIFSQVVLSRDSGGVSYLLVAINMCKGKEDDVSYRQLPQNFGKSEVELVRYRLCNDLCSVPEKMVTSQREIDLYQGRSTETTKSPVDEEEKLDE